MIPKRHVAAVQNCGDGDRCLLGQLLLTLREVARARKLTGSGYRIVTNTGADSGQTVFHLHLHVLGGRPMAWPPGERFANSIDTDRLLG